MQLDSFGCQGFHPWVIKYLSQVCRLRVRYESPCGDDSLQDDLMYRYRPSKRMVKYFPSPSEGFISASWVLIRISAIYQSSHFPISIMQCTKFQLLAVLLTLAPLINADNYGGNLNPTGAGCVDPARFLGCYANNVVEHIYCVSLCPSTSKANKDGCTVGRFRRL